MQTLVSLKNLSFSLHHLSKWVINTLTLREHFLIVIDILKLIITHRNTRKTVTLNQMSILKTSTTTAKLSKRMNRKQHSSVFRRCSSWKVEIKENGVSKLWNRWSKLILNWYSFLFYIVFISLPLTPIVCSGWLKNPKQAKLHDKTNSKNVARLHAMQRKQMLAKRTQHTHRKCFFFFCK